MKRNLIVDVNNLAFSLLHTSKIKPARSKRHKEQYVKEMLFKSVLQTILFHAAKFRCTGLVVAADSKNVWRKDIYAEYKANHDDSHQDPYFEDAIAAIELIGEFIRECTSAFWLAVPRAEADDIIGIWCQNSEMTENIILSSDKDFIQLITEETRLYSPTQRTFRETLDPMYDLFIKCIRGDSGDNIRSAFPKVRETRLKKAWDDDVEMLNLLNEKHPVSGKTVGEHLDLNQRLIDLSEQPVEIKVDILNAINTYTVGKFDEIKAMRFFNENNLKAFTSLLQGAVVLDGQPKFK